MPESDQEVFEHFRSDYANSSREIALLAYARFAQDKYDWVIHKTSKGQPPTPDEIARWIADLPNSRLADIHAGAINLFKEAAEAYMKTRIEQERVDAVERSILGQIEAMAKNVERATSFKATWLPNVFIGVVASFVFTVIVLVSAAIYLRDPSPIAIFKQSSTDAKAPPK